MPRSLLGASRGARISRVAAAVVILVGFVDLARGGAAVGPVVLVAGYLVFVPLSLLVD